MSYPTTTFIEKNIVETSSTKYDITIDQVISCAEKNGQDQMWAYNELLLEKLKSYGLLEKNEFLKYHMEEIFDKKQWMFSLENLITSRTSDTTNLGDSIWRTGLKGVIEICKELINDIDNDMPEKVRKIFTSLSVEVIGYLFLLLKELGYMKPVYMVDINKMIINNFYTKQANPISMKTISEKPTAPSYKVLEKIEMIGIQLAEAARKRKHNLGA